MHSFVGPDGIVQYGNIARPLVCVTLCANLTGSISKKRNKTVKPKSKEKYFHICTRSGTDWIWKKKERKKKAGGKTWKSNIAKNCSGTGQLRPLKEFMCYVLA